MELHGLLRSRRSIRRFSTEGVPQAAIERILASAICAPSAHNSQPWRFVVVTTPSAKSKLAAAMAAEFRADLVADGISPKDVDAQVKRSRSRIENAPLLIVLCMDDSDIDTYPDRRRNAAERAMALQSTANAGAYLLLAVHAEGLGGVWNCAPLFAPDATVTALGLPPGWEPQALFMVGHPAGEPAPRERKPFESATRFV